MVTSDRIQNPHLLEYGTIKNYGELLTDRRQISKSVVKVKATSQKKFVKKYSNYFSCFRDGGPMKTTSVIQTQQPKAPDPLLTISDAFVCKRTITRRWEITVYLKKICNLYP